MEICVCCDRGESEDRPLENFRFSLRGRIVETKAHPECVLESSPSPEALDLAALYTQAPLSPEALEESLQKLSAFKEPEPGPEPELTKIDVSEGLEEEDPSPTPHRGPPPAVKVPQPQKTRRTR